MAKSQLASLFFICLLVGQEAERASQWNDGLSLTSGGHLETTRKSESETGTSCRRLLTRLGTLSSYLDKKLDKLRTKGIRGGSGALRILKLGRKTNALGATLAKFEKQHCTGDVADVRSKLADVHSKLHELASEGGAQSSNLLGAMTWFTERLQAFKQNPDSNPQKFFRTLAANFVNKVLTGQPMTSQDEAAIVRSGNGENEIENLALLDSTSEVLAANEHDVDEDEVADEDDVSQTDLIEVSEMEDMGPGRPCQIFQVSGFSDRTDGLYELQTKRANHYPTWVKDGEDDGYYRVLYSTRNKRWAITHHHNLAGNTMTYSTVIHRSAEGPDDLWWDEWHRRGNRWRRVEGAKCDCVAEVRTSSSSHSHVVQSSDKPFPALNLFAQVLMGVGKVVATLVLIVLGLAYAIVQAVVLGIFMGGGATIGSIVGPVVCLIWWIFGEIGNQVHATFRGHGLAYFFRYDNGRGSLQKYFNTGMGECFDTVAATPWNNVVDALMPMGSVSRLNPINAIEPVWKAQVPVIGLGRL